MLASLFQKGAEKQKKEDKRKKDQTLNLRVLRDIVQPLSGMPVSKLKSILFESDSDDPMDEIREEMSGTVCDSIYTVSGTYLPEVLVFGDDLKKTKIWKHFVELSSRGKSPVVVFRGKKGLWVMSQVYQNNIRPGTCRIVMSAKHGTDDVCIRPAKEWMEEIDE